MRLLVVQTDVLLDVLDEFRHVSQRAAADSSAGNLCERQELLVGV